MRGRTTRVEMRAGSCFELRENGEAAAIDLEVGSLRKRRDLARRRDPTMLVELDAEHVGSFRGDDCVRIMDGAAGFVRHQRDAGGGAADRRYTG